MCILDVYLLYEHTSFCAKIRQYELVCVYLCSHMSVSFYVHGQVTERWQMETVQHRFTDSVIWRGSQSTGARADA